VRCKIPVWFYAFDVLRLNGKDTRLLPLRERRDLLAKALKFKDPLGLTEQHDTNGESYFREACQKGWEGIIAKDGESVYASGRSSDWLKFKSLNEQEFVIAGYTDPKGSRADFGALLVGFYEAGKLRYAGKVGTGYDTNTLESLHAKPDKLRIKALLLPGMTCPNGMSIGSLPNWLPRLLSASGPGMANCGSRVS
jgi:bifunctional non-homologous end joining protein LigD